MENTIDVKTYEIPILVEAKFSEKMGWMYEKYDYMPAIVWVKPNGYLFVKWQNGMTSTNIDADSYLFRKINETEMFLTVFEFHDLKKWSYTLNWFWRKLFRLLINKYYQDKG